MGGADLDGEVADHRVVESLGAVVVQAHVVFGPPNPEFVAAGGQFAYEIGDAPVVGVAPGVASECAVAHAPARTLIPNSSVRSVQEVLGTKSRAELPGTKSGEGRVDERDARITGRGQRLPAAPTSRPSPPARRAG